VAPQQPGQPGQPAEQQVLDANGAPAEGGAPVPAGPDSGRGTGPESHPETETGTGTGEDAGTGEIRAAERQAQRAAAVAVAEGFHPLRIRPYVAEPGGEPAETTVRTLIGVGADSPETADLGLFPAVYAAYEYPQDAEPHPAEAAARAHGRHRRRRRGIVVAAAAVAASALAAGAVAVTGQVLSEGQGGTDRALPDQGTTMPDVTLPDDAGQATGKSAPAVSHPAAPGPTAPTTSPGTTPSASPSTTTPPPAATTAPPATATAPASAPPVATAGGTVAPPPAATTAPATPPPPGPTPSDPTLSPSTSGLVLQFGDSGPAVADLQRRLSAVWVYHGHPDGIYDQDVAQAVATFQIWYGVSGDPSGVYGTHTRNALERATPWV
jgi:Putative peptidoglycan binding domain